MTSAYPSGPNDSEHSVAVHERTRRETRMWCRAQRCGKERKVEGRRKEKDGEGEGGARIGAEEDNTDHDLVFLLEPELERILERLDDHTHTLRREREPVSHPHPDPAQEMLNHQSTICTFVHGMYRRTYNTSYLRRWSAIVLRAP